MSESNQKFLLKSLAKKFLKQNKALPENSYADGLFGDDSIKNQPAKQNFAAGQGEQIVPKFRQQTPKLQKRYVTTKHHQHSNVM